MDAVLLTAATASSDPIRRAVEILRDRGTLVIVGDVGMKLERTPLYEKEVTIRLARSYGPGRYERAYEEWGIDYPVGQVRWTEGRNIEAVLDLLAGGSLSFLASAVGGLLCERRSPRRSASLMSSKDAKASERPSGLAAIP